MKDLFYRLPVGAQMANLSHTRRSLRGQGGSGVKTPRRTDKPPKKQKRTLCSTPHDNSQGCPGGSCSKYASVTLPQNVCLLHYNHPPPNKQKNVINKTNTHRAGVSASVLKVETEGECGASGGAKLKWGKVRKLRADSERQALQRQECAVTPACPH